MSQAFYRKWRPQTWDEVVSQEHVITTLRNAVRTGRIAHAYLLAGPRGTGKTTTARLLAKALNCLDKDTANRPCDKCAHCTAINEGRFLDLIEIDAASNTSVDDVRDLREKINFRPTQGQFKVYIIDEVHMLSTAAFNALLKTLEEPPPHAIFILATTEVHKIPATVLSRCQRYEFRRIPVPDIVKHLKAMAKEEKLQVDEDALVLIARQATGAMRDAISLLDQLASTGERVTLAEAQVVLGTATSSMVIDLVNAILSRDASTGLTLVQTALDAGTDARQFARQVVDYLRGLLLIRMGNANQVDATAEARATMSAQAQQFDNTRLLETIRLFNTASTDARASWHPGLPLEMAFAEAIEEKTPVEPAELRHTESRPAPESRAPVENRPAPRQSAEEPRAVRTPPPLPSEERARGAQAADRPQPAADRPQPAADRSQPAADRSQPAADRSQPAAAEQGRQTVKPAADKLQPAAKDQPEQAEPGQEEPEFEPSQPAPAKSASGITADDLNQNWKRIREFVKKRSPLTEGVLNSSRHSLRDDTLILSFASEVVKSKMDTKENLEILRQALQSILGASLPIRCVLAGKGGSTDEVEGSGMVNAALDLGGKIVYKE